MSGLYDIKESSVIDEEMLEKAIEEQGPQEQAGLLSKKQGLKYDKVTQLRLDYRNILKLDNLWQFTSLTKLQLDNNIIEKIQGLEKLTNLVWLDLSFNNIEVIEGLDTLVKLQDLSLFNNRISVIENLDTLQNLQILSLGNNLISQLDNPHQMVDPDIKELISSVLSKNQEDSIKQLNTWLDIRGHKRYIHTKVIYLRTFQNLRTLDLAGNPVCKDENYNLFVAAYLSDLVYLDYRLLDEQTREKAQNQYQNAIEKIKHNELQEQKVTEAQKHMEQDLQLHKDAFVEYLNGPQLFDSMFADDIEASKLAHLPGVATLLESYQTQLEALCMQIFEAGLTQHTQRQNEVECFFTCFRKAVKNNQQKGAQIVADFERSRREVMAEMQQATDQSVLKVSVRNEIMQIRDTLLTLELQLVAQLEEIIKDFERNITDIVGGFAEYTQGIFAQCRDLENQHHEKVLEIAVETLERVAKNELEQDLPDEVHLLVLDKDMMNNAVSASHDTHLLKIDNREDELLTRINSWKSALMKSIHDEEVERNRKRISEIHKYCDYAWEQLEEKPVA